MKREVCFIFLGQWPKTSGPPAERLPTTLIKLYITKPEKQAKQIFPCNLRFLNHFRRLSQRCSAVQQILSDRSNKTAFYVSRETFWWTAIFWNKKPNNLWRWVLNLKAFKKKCFWQALKATYCWSGRCFWDFLIPIRKVSSKSFSEFERETDSLSGKIFVMVKKTALYTSRW